VELFYLQRFLEKLETPNKTPNKTPIKTYNKTPNKPLNNTPYKSPATPRLTVEHAWLPGPKNPKP
jgi:hypothetical protein